MESAINLDLGLMLEFSNHATQRASQRGVTRNIMRIMVEQGELIRKQGLKFYYMTHNTLRYFDLKTQNKLRNLVVLVKSKSYGDIVITCYKDEKAIKNIKHKQKHLAKYTKWRA
jgi:hypothetical protein